MIECPGSHPRFLLALFLVFLGGISWGCAPTLRWVPDTHTPDQPSCLPDRLLQWKDFVPKTPEDNRGAETAVRFSIDQPNRRIVVAFDPSHSWVKPELVYPQTSLQQRTSDHLLAHEQVHYLISCLVVRQANRSPTTGENLSQMLSLVRSVAQRLNLQYDKETQHGTQPAPQKFWQKEVMEQLVELSSSGKMSRLVRFTGTP